MNIAEIEDFDNVIIIHIFGSLSVKVINEAESIWYEQLNKSPEILAFDCINLDFIDSIAINHLFKLSKKAISSNTKLVIFNLNASLNNIFSITRLDSLFTIMTKEKFDLEYMIDK